MWQNSSGFDLSVLIQTLLTLAISGSIFVLFIVLFIFDIRTLKKNYKIGLILGGLVFLIMVPPSIFNLIHFDPAAVFNQIQMPSQGKEFVKYSFYIGFVMGFGILFLKIGWYMMVYHVGVVEWDKINRDAFPILRKSPNIPWRSIIGAGAFGISAGILSTVIFWLLGVEVHDLVKQTLKMFPGVQEASLFIRIPIVLMAVIAPAITEELFFRGGLLAFLVRLSKNRSLALVGSVVLVSLLWAALHGFNTDMPLVKYLQIFIIGIVFCEFARRSCLESAIIGHIGLNVSAVILTFLLPA